MMKMRLLTLMLVLTVLCSAMPLQRLKQMTEEQKVLDSASRAKAPPDVGEALLGRFGDFADILGDEKAQGVLAGALGDRYTALKKKYAGFIGIEESALDATGHADMFIKAVLLFVTRVQTEHDELVRAYDLATTFKIVGITIQGNDPHHHQRRVIMFTTNGGITVVYKPAPMDAAYYYNSDAAESFVTMMNQWITEPKFRLKTIVVLSYPDADGGAYGFIEYVAQYKAELKDQQFVDFSYVAGMQLAAQLVCGMTDMHVENMMTYVTSSGVPQPVVIDAETMFDIAPNFGVGSTASFLPGTGAFTAAKMFYYHEDYPDVDFNAVITWKKVGGHPPDPNVFTNGFKAAMTFFDTNREAVLNWIRTVVADDCVVRYVPITTAIMKQIPTAHLAGDTCSDMAKTNMAVLNTDVNWRYISMFGNNCGNLTPMLARADIPTCYHRMNSANIFFPDMSSLTLNNLPVITGTSQSAAFAQRILEFGELTNLNLLDNTIRALTLARVDRLLDEKSVEGVLAELDVSMKMLDVIIDKINKGTLM